MSALLHEADVRVRLVDQLQVNLVPLDRPESRVEILEPEIQLEPETGNVVIDAGVQIRGTQLGCGADDGHVSPRRWSASR